MSSEILIYLGVGVACFLSILVIAATIEVLRAIYKAIIEIKAKTPK